MTMLRGPMRKGCCCVMAQKPCGRALLQHQKSMPIGAFRPTLTLLEKAKRYRGSGQQGTSENAVNPLTKPSNLDKGALHVVSVPIGNLKDFSLRALEVLRRVDYIVCTNRQGTKYLLELVDVDVSGRLIHYRPHGNGQLVEMLRGGRSLALVVPSGTPCIADDGNSLVKEMLAQGVRVTSVPGPCAVTAALSVSGLGSDDGAFFFAGYLSDKQGPRLRQLRHCAALSCPCIMYEYPRRILAVLSDIAAVMPKRRVALLHELSKVHESLHCDTAEKLVAYYTKSSAAALLDKGQVVVVIEGAQPDEAAVPADGELKRREEYLHDLVVQHTPSCNGDVWAATGLVSTSIGVPREVVRTAYESWERRLQRDRVTETPAAEVSTGSTPPVASRRKRRRALLLKRIERRQERLRLLMMSTSPGAAT